MNNDVDRDKFYGRTSNDWDDDGVEYEVEPPDVTVDELKKQRVSEAIQEAGMSIDVDEIYRDLYEPKNDPWPIKLPTNVRFQFQIKHILIATAVLAVLLTLVRLHALTNVGGVLLLAVVGGALAYAEVHEQKRCMEAERRWQEKFDRRKQYFEEKAKGRQRKPGDSPTIYDDALFDGVKPAPLPTQPFRLQFSLRHLFVVMTMSAVLLCIINLLGGPAVVAMVLGVVAFTGLIAHALGADPPRFVVLGWWVILALYVVLGLITELQHAF